MSPADGEEFKLRYVNFQTIAKKVVTERSESRVHANDKHRQAGFWFRNHDLSIIGVLHYKCVRRMKTKVISKRTEQNRTVRRALEDPLLYGTRSRCFNLAIRASEANTLSVTVQVILEP